MADVLKLEVPGKPEYVGTVRLAASSVAMAAGFDVEAIDDIKVAVSEACANIIKHGGETPADGSGTDGADAPPGGNGAPSYEVWFETSDEALAIHVKDSGKGYDTAGYVPPVPGEAKQGGLGHFIIRALMDDVEIVSNIGKGTQVSMKKLRPPKGEAGEAAG